MGQIRRDPEFSASDLVRSELGTSVKILAVGASPRALSEETYGMVPGVSFISFESVTEYLLAENAPEVVLSPLVMSEFDCLELAHRLVDAGFSGRYRVMANKVPQPSIIRSEVRASFPGLDFDILVMGGARTNLEH